MCWNAESSAWTSSPSYANSTPGAGVSEKRATVVRPEGLRRQAALDLDDLDPARREVLLQRLDPRVRVHVLRTREQVDRCIAELGPGVDRQVRLGDDRHARTCSVREFDDLRVEKRAAGAS